MLVNLGKGLILRLLSYAVFLWGFWLLFQAFERSNIAIGIGGGAAILVAMWAMVGFRRVPAFRPKPPPGDDAETGAQDGRTP